MKQLTTLEMLKLSLQYSISKKHQKSLIERIDQLENKPVKKAVKKKVIQESFIQEGYYEVCKYRGRR